MHATRTKICRPRSAATERVAPDRPRRTGRATHLLPWLWLILLWIRPVNVSALPADSANPTNPIVRFSVIRGTNLLGAMDVELFEQEKPATVRNFLLYLQSGAYTNSFFHRCVPGFAVQGGGFTVTNATATNGFLDYLAVTNFGRLTNEFLVGPRLSNTFGTLAMAKLGGDPDSATSQWFFNLGNNTTNLDNQNGGFTVFGRVLESTNSFDGTNVLQHFSSLSTNAGIVNLGNLRGPAYSVFSDLPVSYLNTVFRAPAYNELYYPIITLLNRTNSLPGTNPPTVSLLSPLPDTRFTNQLVTLSGTAADDTGIGRVVYRFRDGPLEVATGTTNWSVAVRPFPGFNSFTAQSIDCDGNFSTNSVAGTFYYVTNVSLTLHVNGDGSVSGVTNGQRLEQGRFYTAIAKPRTGSVFESWTGSVASAGASISFLVPTNSTNISLAATFIIDPFLSLAGSYHGIFLATSTPSLESAGFITLQMSRGGKFSGNMSHRGGSYRYTGAFDRSGNASLRGVVGRVARTVSLRLETTNLAGLITGSMAGGSALAEVRLERLASALPKTNAPPTGRYTAVFSPTGVTGPSQLFPAGAGYATAVLDKQGLLKCSGRLGDGTSIAISKRVTRLGRWPVYTTLQGTRSVVTGWIGYSNSQPSILVGSLQWVNPPRAGSSTYPGGFTNQLALVAAPYVPPAQNGRALDWVHGLSQLSGANLITGITNLVKLTLSNTLDVLSSNSAALKLTIDTKTGLFSGSFLHSWVGSTNTLRGVVAPGGSVLRGQFPDGDQTGDLTVNISPFLVTQSISGLSLSGFTAAVAEGGLLRFTNDGTLTLTSPLSVPYHTLLDANGHSVFIRGGGTTRLFEVSTNRNFAALGLTFADGAHHGTQGADASPPQPGSDGCGAGILNLGGAIGLTNCVLTNFVVQGGDAGARTGTNLQSVAGGRGLGAAICNQGGRVTLDSCQFIDNRATGGQNNVAPAGALLASPAGGGLAGALFSDGGDCLVTNTLFLRNQAWGGAARLQPNGSFSQAGDALGGALACSRGRLFLWSSQCLSNSAAGAGTPTNSLSGGSARGGAVWTQTNAQAVIETTRFAGNAAAGGDTGPTASPGSGSGGALHAAGSLQLKNCALEQNTARGGSSVPAGAGLGGGVAAFGTFLLTACTLNDNLAEGGRASTLGTNANSGAAGSGGAIYADGGPFNATNSTLASNRALGGAGTNGPAGDYPPGDGNGGAMIARSNSATLVHLTLAYNQAAAGAPAGTNFGSAQGGAIASLGAAVSMFGSLLATNTPGNVSGVVSDLGYNLASDSSFSFTGTGSRTNVVLQFGPLTTNGGPTLTLAPSSDSPALDLIPTNPALVDQRGTARPQGTRVDAGAVELLLAEKSPAFTIQPFGATVRAGSNITFQVLAVGASPITYLWLKDGLPLTAATNATLALVNVQTNDAGAYRVEATNPRGTATSSVATLTVNANPLILTQPNDVLLPPGAAAIFSVAATGPTLTYFWLHNATPISGETNATLTRNPALAPDQGTYQVIISNFAGVATSRLANLVFDASALRIVAQPQSLAVTQGQAASFTVTASGVQPLSYQWFFASAPALDATNSVLSFAAADATNAGAYFVVVTNEYRSVTSSVAGLTLVAPALAAAAVAGPPILAIETRAEHLLIICRGAPGQLHRLLQATTLGPDAAWEPVLTNAMPASGQLLWTRPRPTRGTTYFRAASP